MRAINDAVLGGVFGGPSGIGEDAVVGDMDLAVGGRLELLLVAAPSLVGGVAGLMLPMG